MVGIIRCVANDKVKFVKVVRVGSRVPVESSKTLDGLPALLQVFRTDNGEINLMPEDDHQRISSKVGRVLKCDPCSVRL